MHACMHECMHAHIHMEEQLKIITVFSNDIGMEFGEDKCAFMSIVRGERKMHGNSIYVEGLEIYELQVEDSYKYLGLDEDIAHKGELNKNRFKTEYLNRVLKIWKSELHSKNKIQAQNVFAVRIITGTFGVLDWTKEEVSDINVKTRKLLTCTGNFHGNSNVDRLCTTRENGGRGLSIIFGVFIVRLLSLVEHLKATTDTHKYLNLVLQHEDDRLVRISQELQQRLGLDIEQGKKDQASHIEKKRLLKRTTCRLGTKRSSTDSS